MTQLFFLCLFLLNYFRYCSIVIRSHGYSLACIESVRQCVMGCTVQYVASWVCVLAAGQVDWGPGELGQQPVVLRSHVGQHRLNKNKMSRPLLLRPINMFFKQGREAWFFFFSRGQGCGFESGFRREKFKEKSSKSWKNARKLVIIGILLKYLQLHGFYGFAHFCQKTGAGSVFKKTDGSGSALRKTAGSGSAKNKCRSTALSRGEGGE